MESKFVNVTCTSNYLCVARYLQQEKCIQLIENFIKEINKALNITYNGLEPSSRQPAQKIKENKKIINEIKNNKTSWLLGEFIN